jgi:lipopolysaccharide/colanic/teichoic acid biosynthesis glycosyltransferase
MFSNNANVQWKFWKKRLNFTQIDRNHGNNHVFDEEFGFYSEQFFRKMLITERKRTERSHRPIVLVILNLAGILDAIPRKQIIGNIS